VRGRGPGQLSVFGSNPNHRQDRGHLHDERQDPGASRTTMQQQLAHCSCHLSTPLTNLTASITDARRPRRKHITMTTRHCDDERGQILVIVAGALLVIIALVGLVIDGGYAWGQQRQTQNAADAASEAGALQLAENIAGTSPANTDADVLAAVNASGLANGIGNPVAFYTNDHGQLLTAAGAVTTSEAQAAR